MSEQSTIEKAIEKSMAGRNRATGLQELGILRQAGPREHRSLHAAQAIFDNIAEIEQLAGEQGTLYQDDRAERYEWCRLVAMVIEVYMGVSKCSLSDLQSSEEKLTSAQRHTARHHDR